MSVHLHNSKTALPKFTKFYVHFPCGRGSVLLDGIAICYVLPVLRMTSCFHAMGPMGGRTGTALCSSQAPVDVAAGRAPTAAAHWLTARRAGLSGPGQALAVQRLDSAAAGVDGARFAVCFMLVVSCSAEQSLMSVIALLVQWRGHGF